MKDKGVKKDRLEGETIYLRLMGAEDTENIIRWRNTDFVRSNFIYQKPFTRAGHENWMKNMSIIAMC